MPIRRHLAPFFAIEREFFDTVKLNKPEFAVISISARLRPGLALPAPDLQCERRGLASLDPGPSDGTVCTILVTQRPLSPSLISRLAQIKRVGHMRRSRLDGRACGPAC